MPVHSDTQSIAKTLDTLMLGGLAILPTETVYGLAARADNKASIDRLYTLKGREFDKPLALCVESIDMAESYGFMRGLAAELAQEFWPGPLSLIIKAKSSKLDDRLYGQNKNGRKTISLRCPEADWLKSLGGLPLALTSANPSGQTAPTNIEQASAYIGDGVDAILLGPPCAVGVSSTILAIDGREATILRQGNLTPEDFMAFNIQGQDW